MWFAGHGDAGIDGLTRVEGQTWIFQCKHLLTRADAQRLSRRSVLVFIGAGVVNGIRKLVLAHFAGSGADSVIGGFG
jgi:hypothetical protein